MRPWRIVAPSIGRSGEPAILAPQPTMWPAFTRSSAVYLAVYQASGWFYIKPTDDMGSPTFNSYVWIAVSFLDGAVVSRPYTSGDFYPNVSMGEWFQYQVTNVQSIVSG